MVQEIKLCFGTSLRKLWGSCLGGNQPKQRVRREWGSGEAVWSNIESHHWLLWTRAIRWSPLFVSCVNWIPFTFCLLESDKPSTQQGWGQTFLNWMTSWSSGGVGAGEGDLYNRWVRVTPHKAHKILTPLEKGYIDLTWLWCDAINVWSTTHEILAQNLTLNLSKHYLFKHYLFTKNRRDIETC